MDSLQTSFTIVVAIATTAYVAFTAFMWWEMRKTNERLNRPNVEAILEPGRRWANLCEFTLRNSGNTSVFDVRVDIDPADATGLDDKPLKDLNLFKNVIPVMIPQQEYRMKMFLYPDLVKKYGGDVTFNFDVTT